jgi:hypothetical protein
MSFSLWQEKLKTEARVTGNKYNLKPHEEINLTIKSLNGQIVEEVLITAILEETYQQR